MLLMQCPFKEQLYTIQYYGKCKSGTLMPIGQGITQNSHVRALDYILWYSLLGTQVVMAVSKPSIS